MILDSTTAPAVEWADSRRYAQTYGEKAAGVLAIPRAWTLPFLLVSADDSGCLARGDVPPELAGQQGAARLLNLAGDAGQIIVRSSVLGESIWDRGTYDSILLQVNADTEATLQRLVQAAMHVIGSANGRSTGLLIQRHLRPAAQGEFGNLQRVSKTRDQWEIATREASEVTSRTRLNSQRDSAADPEAPLAVRAGLARERLFGGIAAWLNNELLLGKSQRLNCEWVTDNLRYFLVQIDEEDEDLSGINLTCSPKIMPLVS